MVQYGYFKVNFLCGTLCRSVRTNIILDSTTNYFSLNRVVQRSHIIISSFLECFSDIFNDLTDCDLVTTFFICVNTGPHDGLVTDGTMPLRNAFLTCHYFGHPEHTPKYFGDRILGIKNKNIFKDVFK